MESAPNELSARFSFGTSSRPSQGAHPQACRVCAGVELGARKIPAISVACRQAIDAAGEGGKRRTELQTQTPYRRVLIVVELAWWANCRMQYDGGALRNQPTASRHVLVRAHYLVELFCCPPQLQGRRRQEFQLATIDQWDLPDLT
jgi:hypothetical protein